jgi:hypothetical protein
MKDKNILYFYSLEQIQITQTVGCADRVVETGVLCPCGRRQRTPPRSDNQGRPCGGIATGRRAPHARFSRLSNKTEKLPSA